MGGPRRRRGPVVGFVTGGEPVDGCNPVALLIAGDAISDFESRAATLGVWHPHLWPKMTPSRAEADRVLDDPDGVIWRIGAERSWQSSTSWPVARQDRATP